MCRPYPLCLWVFVCALHVPAAGEMVAGVLSDDTWTRGNWPGNYGSYVHYHFGANAPHSLFGGLDGVRIRIKVRTGDPNERARAWLSTMNTVRDDRALLFPKAGKRIASAWDDYGEEKGLGNAPGLHLDVDFPGGRPGMLSLYFFEIDWLQHRDYKITVLSRDLKKPILTTEVAHFFGGTYKRFVFGGPHRLTFVIDAGLSANAIVSGLFIDSVPKLIQVPEHWGDDSRFNGVGRDDLQAAYEQLEAECAASLGTFLEKATGEKDYILSERQRFAFFEPLQAEKPSLFYFIILAAGRAAQERLDRFTRLTLNPERLREAFELQYLWAGALMEPPRQWAALEDAIGFGLGPVGLAKDRLREGEVKTISSRVEIYLSEEDPINVAGKVRSEAARLLELGRIDLVGSVMGKLHRRFPDQLVAADHFYWGNGLLYQQKYAEAEKHFARCLNADLDAQMEAWAYLNQTTCQVRLGELVKARTGLAALEKKQPEAPELSYGYFQLGSALLSEGEKTAAKAAFKRAVETGDGRDRLVQEAERILESLDR